ncbi:DUF4268 domain-containing protein [Piscinibacterium candidicorallinum]|uniref:DUF4268 domain-containing protein n=1 Tax=Piscinibacterium candidicorallinum TaxID=1793872 RepID=A0ABV7H1K5_9BURK
MKSPLGKLERMPLRRAWAHEAGEFTPWLAQDENLEMLAEALGLSELELVATEHPVGDFKVDILCTDGDGKVIIENQLERTNHGHLGQILTYAAGVGARKVVWLAESFRSEHVAALEFLNQNTTEDLDFFAVEVELWKIADSPMAPSFNVVVKPNEWSKVGRENARAASAASPTKQLQHRFWTGLVEYEASNRARFRFQTPKAQHWIISTIGRAGFHIGFTVNTRDRRLGVELYINAEDAKSQFQRLREQRQSIEQAFGAALDWQELPERNGCRIALYGHEGFDLEDEGSWPTAFAWMSQQGARFHEVFRPVVKALP